MRRPRAGAVAAVTAAVVLTATVTEVAGGAPRSVGATSARSGERGGGVPYPETYVTTLSGTDSRYDLSHGNLLPLVVRPWGASAWAPQTDNDPTYASWWFHPTDRRFFGLRCTHQPSPWISDYGNLRIMPSITDPSHADPWQFSGYDPDAAQWSPYLFNATLIAYGTASGGNLRVELTATNHSSIMRFTYPPYINTPTSTGFNQTRRVLLALNDVFSDQLTLNAVTSASISGSTVANSGGTPSNFRFYFSATLESGVTAGAVPRVIASAVVNDGTNIYAYFDFDPTDPNSNVIIMRVGTSLISQAQATVALNAEVGGGVDFDTVATASQLVWRDTLSAIQIVDVGSGYTPEQEAGMLEVFYSSLYRATIFPRFLTEYTANGTALHYSPYDPNGGIYPGDIVSDSGFWDAYRTVYPYLSIVYPHTLGRMIQGWVNAYKEGGWLPKWASPGYRGAMVGTMGDGTLADAIVKNITGFDVAGAYAAIRQDAFVVPPATDGVGRLCLASYLQNGYVAEGAQGTAGTCTEVVSRTLNYILSDFAIGQAAAALGYTADATILAARARNYSLLFDAQTGFFRSRAPGMGPFTTPFDEFSWGGDYTEAGPWQYRFYVPHDPQGLAALYNASGRSMCDTLQTAQTMPSTFHIGAYGSEIHEQTEMALLCWGQYEHDNQPVHHMLYQFIAQGSSTTTGCAANGQYWLRRATSTLYVPGADMFCGDEDNGQVAAWYLLSAMGLYALAPGTPNYVLGSPLFGHMQITLPNSRVLDIVAPNNSGDNVYVQSVTWNGAPVAGTAVSYFDIMKGGVLQFNVAGTPPSTSDVSAQAGRQGEHSGHAAHGGANHHLRPPPGPPAHAKPLPRAGTQPTATDGVAVAPRLRQRK